MIDAHRRRRGQRGALQRPRPLLWLSRALGHDPWLVQLTVEILVWVGVPDTAGLRVWPVDAWAQRRAEVTGDWIGSEPAVVEREVELVLAVMRRRPRWYQAYVETPLGRKRLPVANGPTGPDDPGTLPRGFSDRHEVDDAHLVGLAAEAVTVLGERIGRGQDPQLAVVQVLGALFGGGTGADRLDRPPHATDAHEDRLAALLDDPGEVRRLVAEVLAIVVGGRVSPPSVRGMYDTPEVPGIGRVA